MALLHPPTQPSRTFLKRVQTTITCPFNGHQVGWCRGLCAPVGGTGVCGRVAPHALLGRTQVAIAASLAARAVADES